jgi:hypothetical protein
LISDISFLTPGPHMTAMLTTIDDYTVMTLKDYIGYELVYRLVICPCHIYVCYVLNLIVDVVFACAELHVVGVSFMELSHYKYE